MWRVAFPISGHLVITLLDITVLVKTAWDRNALWLERVMKSTTTQQLRDRSPCKKLGRNQMLYRNIKALQWQDRLVWFLRKLFLQHEMSLKYFSFEGKLLRNSIIQEDKLFVSSLITPMFFCEELIPFYIAAWEGCSKNADRSILWYTKFEVHFCVINAAYALGCGLHINDAVYPSGAVELAKYLHGTLCISYRIIF